MKTWTANGLMAVLVAVTLMMATLEATPSDELHWRLYKSKHNKAYANPGEESMRKAIFLGNKQRIERHNAESASKLGFKLGYSHLTDWTSDELEQLTSGVQLTADRLKETPQEEYLEFLKEILAVDVQDLPKRVDWRKVAGRVGPVKSGGDCFSDWAFATTGLLEGQQQVRLNLTDRLIPLSEQNLMDCWPPNSSCDHGHMAAALNDVARNGGIESDKDYPTSLSFVCTFDRTKAVMTTVKGGLVLPNSVEALQKVVAQYGPVAAALHVTQHYLAFKAGVLDDKTCQPGYINHAVLIVGYDTTDDGRDYWIVKDSWGEDWGDKGYINIVRNAHDRCGLATIATIAQF